MKFSNGNPNLPQEDLRVRAIGKLIAIGTLVGLVAVGVALAGCKPVEPAGASGAAGHVPEATAKAAPANQNRTDPVWLKADPVIYSPEDWQTPPGHVPSF